MLVGIVLVAILSQFIIDCDGVNLTIASYIVYMQDGTTISTGLNERAAIALAVEEMNAGITGVMGITHPLNLTIDMVSSNDFLDQKKAMLDAIAFCNAGASVILGADYSSISKIVNLAAGSFGVAQISGSSTNKDLSNKDIYSTFMRTIPSDEQQGKAMARIVYDLGWRYVATLTNDDSYAAGLILDFEHGCLSLGIEILSSIQYTAFYSLDHSTDEIVSALEAIKKSGAKIIALGAYDFDAFAVMKVARSMKMAGPGSQYVWVGNDGWITPSIFEVDPEEKDLFVGVIGTLPYNGDKTLQHDKFQDRVQNVSESFWSKWETTPDSFLREPFGYFYYDAVYVVAHAASKLVGEGDWDPSCDDCRQRLLQEMMKVDFLGVTGRVAFDAYGDPLEGKFSLANIRSGMAGENPHVIDRSFGLITGDASPFKTQPELAQKIEWANGIGFNAPQDIIIYRLSESQFYLYLILASLGMAHSAALIPWIIARRETAVILAAAPPFVVVFLVGATICNVGLSMTMINLNNLPDDESSCSLVPDFLVSMGFSLALSALVVKAYRVNKVFNSDIQRVIIKDSQLYPPIVFLVLCDVVLYLVQTFTDPLVRQSYRDSSVKYFYCHSETRTMYLAFVFVPKAVMIVQGVTIAYQSRNIIAAFNESKILAIVIYNMAFCYSLVLMMSSMSFDRTFVKIASAVLMFWVINSSVGAYGLRLAHHIYRYGYNGGFTKDDDDVVSKLKVPAAAIKKGAKLDTKEKVDGPTVDDKIGNILMVTGTAPAQKQRSKVHPDGTSPSSGSSVPCNKCAVLEERVVVLEMQAAKNLEFYEINCSRLKRGESEMTAEEIALDRFKSRRVASKLNVSRGGEKDGIPESGTGSMTEQSETSGGRQGSSSALKNAPMLKEIKEESSRPSLMNTQ